MPPPPRLRRRRTFDLADDFRLDLDTPEVLAFAVVVVVVAFLGVAVASVVVATLG